MVGAVSFHPYVSSYQYTGNSRMRLQSQDTQSQAGRAASVKPAAGEASAAAQKAGGTSSVIGARSLTAAGHTTGVAGGMAIGRAADPDTPVEPVDAVSKTESGTAGRTDYAIPFMRAGMDPAELAVRMRIEYTGMPQPGKENGSEAAEMRLPGTGAEQTAQAGVSGTAAGTVQPELPGMKSADEKAVELNLPGTKSGDEEAVELNLPGTKSADAEAVELNLPGTSADKVAEAGLSGASSKDEQTDAAGDGSEKKAPKVAGTGVEDTQKAMNDAECKTCKERKYQDGSDDPGVSFKTPAHIDPGQASSAVRGHELEHVVRERARAQKEGRRVISQSVTMQTGICPECGRVYTAGGVTRTVTAADTKPKEAPKDPKWILMNSAA